MKKLLIVLLIFISFTACSSSGQNYDYAEETMETSGDIYEDESFPSDYSTEATYESTNTGVDNVDSLNEDLADRKLIENYEIYSETTTYDKVKADVEGLINKYKGYTTNVYENSQGIKSLNAEIKIPRDSSDEFINDLEELEGIVINSKDKLSTDVTDAYRDNNIRLESLENKLDRLYSLQEEQGDLQDLLTVEQEIETTTYEIERIKNQQSNIDTMSTYSQITFYLEEVTVYQEPSNVQIPFSEEVGAAINDSANTFINGLQGFVIWFIYAFPYLLILLIILIIVLFLSKRYRSKKSDKKVNERPFKTRLDLKKKENDLQENRSQGLDKESKKDKSDDNN